MYENLGIPEHIEKNLSPQFISQLEKSLKKDRSEIERASACYRSISSEKTKRDQIDVENLQIFPGYTQVSPRLFDDRLFGQDYQCDYNQTIRDTCNQGKTNTAKRGKIHEFSRKARIRLIKLFNSLDSLPLFHSTLTFSDDVFGSEIEGAQTIMEISERATYATECLRYMTQWINDTFQGRLWAIWKREWEPRKSGDLKGELLPHFHVLFGGAVDRAEFRTIARRIQRRWVEITGTREKEIALKVALHGASYQWLKSARMANFYIAKYMSKLLSYDLSEEDSIGRFWGKIGPVPVAPPVEVSLLPEVALRVRRFFRRKVARTCKSTKNRRIGLADRLKRLGEGVFILMRKETVLRIVEYCQKEFENSLLEGLVTT